MKIGTYTVNDPTHKFIKWVEKNCVFYTARIRHPGKHVIEVVIEDYQLGSYDGCVGISDCFNEEEQ